MKKSTIIIINIVVSVLAVIIFISLNTEKMRSYENKHTIIFALLCTGVPILQLVINLGFSIYFFVTKNKEMGNFFLFSTLVAFFVVFISFPLVGLISLGNFVN